MEKLYEEFCQKKCMDIRKDISKAFGYVIYRDMYIVITIYVFMCLLI